MQRGDRHQRQQRAEDEDEGGKHRERESSTRQRRTPASRDPDSKDDGEGFDDLDEGTEERSRYGGKDGCETVHAMNPE